MHLGCDATSRSNSEWKINAIHIHNFQKISSYVDENKINIDNHSITITSLYTDTIISFSRDVKVKATQLGAGKQTNIKNQLVVDFFFYYFAFTTNPW